MGGRIAPVGLGGQCVIRVFVAICGGDIDQLTADAGSAVRSIRILVQRGPWGGFTGSGWGSADARNLCVGNKTLLQL
jgi:hypothetical protein